MPERPDGAGTGPANTPSEAAPGTNMLGRETSPYLLQHKDNPVHWMPWGEAAFARAAAEGKPILLSIGYAACHWCHVMAHESFEDPETAALMNALFVNVKVDREERPDLDQVYQAALAAMGQPGGWPLTAFLTPDGEPFWGGTYFPPAPRWGRPAFAEVLRGVAATYGQDRGTVEGNVAALRDALSRLGEGHPGEAVTEAILDEVADRLLGEVDPVHGGIGHAPKFPQATILELLWRAWRRTGRMPFRAAVLRTLGRMCRGGIYDHLGGGFARYSTDERWLVPHFEKMLYDNALLVDLMTLVWRETRDPMLESRIRETVGWILREMVAEGSPAFAGSLDADSEGADGEKGEGRFYVWTEAEIDALLGEAGPEFKRAYGVTSKGNWAGEGRKGVSVLNLLDAPDSLDEAAEARLAAGREILRAAREARPRPDRDDKVLADWNGLAIAALAHAGLALDEPGWVEAAERALDFVSERMVVGGRLRHSWRRGSARHPGTLDDHANVARAAIALHEATGQPRHLDRAAAWVEEVDRHHADGEGAGYFLAAADADRLIVRARDAADGATPSGNGTMVHVLARLWLLTGEERHRARAEALVRAFSGELRRNFFPVATLLNGAELLLRARQLVVVGEPGAADTRALLDAVRTTSAPNLALTVLAPGTPLPPGHPARDKGMVGGRATAYLCRDMACLAPVTEPADLKANLTAR
jgi:uncharacterized protein YyaL (SSP411 family)